MDYLLEMLKANWYYLAAGIVICIGAAVYAGLSRKKSSAIGDEFLAANPDAAKIYLTLKLRDSYEPVKVHNVGGSLPSMFYSDSKSGFYLLPGKNEVEISYKYIVGSMVYRHAARSTGKIKKELFVEANKSYHLSFDRETEQFTFEELQK